ncbi:MAG: TonB-dependent receptor [Bacteroidaceae bacterium]|nr:TonB-dependent receptor [Bacteroidaceae bacterium]
MKAIERLTLTLILAFATVFSSSAQNSAKQYTVSGRIIDADEGTPLELVNITFENNTFWAITDLNGKFQLKLKDGEYHYSVSYVGYETAKGTVKVNGKDISNLVIKLQGSSLALGEVVVTAKEQAMGSSSVIDQTALQHLQAKSVEDMLQLMPGAVTSNPSVTSVGQASIREINGSNNNAMGTSVIVNGSPISNDATMMTFNTAKSGNSGISGQSTTGMGMDLRTISTDNVESIEVIRGIPSVEYGNLTSGAMIIKTKQGATPLEAKGKTDPNSKMASVGKGFTLRTGTTVNLAADYTSAYNDIRFKANGYERVTGDLSLSQTFFSNRPLSVNAKFAYFQNINSVRKDPQAQNSEIRKSDNKGVRMSLNGDWNLKSLIISNLSYNLSLNYSHQLDTRKEFMILKNGMQPIGFSTEDGPHMAPILKGNYYSDYYIDGKPTSAYVQVKGTKTIMKSEELTSSFKAGAEWSYDHNNGEGLVFDPYMPPVINDLQTVRPRAYSDIPAMSTISGFFENKTIFPIGKTSMTIQAGVRASSLHIDRDYLDRSNISTVDPRINAEWSVLNKKNNDFLDNLSFTGGWGLTTKMPSLSYLYPDKSYYDELSYYNMSPAIAITTTNIIQSTGNPDLKPSTGRKFEFGVSAEKSRINGTITFYHENYTNEFGYSTVVFADPFLKYNFNLPADAQDLSYSGGQVHYTKDGTQYHVDPISMVADSLFQSYERPNNTAKSEKYGIEYSINFGQVKALRTSLVVDGAWMYVKRQSALDSWSEMGSLNGSYYPYAVLRPGGSGSINQRVNTNFRFITHIPQVKMVFTTTAQVIWGESRQYIYQDENGNDLWYKTTNYNGIDCLAVDPVGYKDYAGNYYAWDTKFRDKIYKNAEYEMISTYSTTTYFEKEKYPAYAIFNFRLTKELGDRLEFSFMANNMFNTRKIHKNKNTSGYSIRTIPQYFGAELKIKI